MKHKAKSANAMSEERIVASSTVSELIGDSAPSMKVVVSLLFVPNSRGEQEVQGIRNQKLLKERTNDRK